MFSDLHYTPCPNIIKCYKSSDYIIACFLTRFSLSFLSIVDIDVIPVGADLVKVWGVESELFLMIDDQGQMRGTVSLTEYFLK